MAGICDKLKPIKFIILFIVSVHQLVNAGVMFFYGISVEYTSTFDDALEDEEVKEPIGAFKDRMPNGRTTSEEVEEVSLSVLIAPLGTLLVGFGSISFCMALFGVCAASRLNIFRKCLPKTDECWYALWTLFATVDCLIATAAILTYHWKNRVIERILLDMVSEYRGIDGTDEPSRVLNTIMIGFKCCGVNGYYDFDESENWPPKTLDTSGYILALPKGKTAAYQTPVACCKDPEMIRFGCFIKGIANKVNNNLEPGCIEPLSEVADSMMYTSSGILVWIAITCFVSTAACLLFFITGPQEEPKPKPKPKSKTPEPSKSTKSSEPSKSSDSDKRPPPPAYESGSFPKRWPRYSRGTIW